MPGLSFVSTPVEFILGQLQFHERLQKQRSKADDQAAFATLPEGALSEVDEEVKVALAPCREAHGRDAVAELLSDFGDDEALRIVGLLADFDRRVKSHKACGCVTMGNN